MKWKFSVLKKLINHQIGQTNKQVNKIRDEKGDVTETQIINRQFGKSRKKMDRFLDTK